MDKSAEERIISWLRFLCLIATLILICAISSGAVSFKAKSYTEQRIEALENHWLDQKRRNDAQDRMNDIIEKELEHAAGATPHN